MHELTDFQISPETESVRFTIRVRTTTLYPYPRRPEQLELLAQVVRLRDLHQLTFAAIAAELSGKGLKSLRGKPLSAEIVFSIYKKGTRQRVKRE